MDFTLTSNDFYVLGPVLTLCLGIATVLLLDLFLPKGQTRRRTVEGFTFLFLAIALYLSLYQFGQEKAGPSDPAFLLGPLLKDVWNFRMHTVIGAVLIEAITLVTLLISTSFLTKEDEFYHGEYYSLLLCFALGAILMVSTKNLVLAILGLEIFSISLYIMVAARRHREQAVEAGLKYFLLGAFASAFFLYGIALIYAGNGNVSIPAIGQVAHVGVAGPQGLAAIGGTFLFGALFFKASVAPFHMWTPDVYQGAPTPITALMSTGTKTAAFLLLTLCVKFIPVAILPLIPVLTILTIVIGNVGALRQTNLKRLLAYSGVAHAGYLMVGFSSLVMGTGHGTAYVSIRAMLFYLASYAVTNLAAFAVIAFLERKEASAVTLDGIRGLWKRNPMAASVLALSVLSLAGIPPTAGFWAKFLIFSTAIQAGLPILAIIGILASVVGVYYYLKIVVYAFFLPAEDESPIDARGWGARIAIALMALAILAVGFQPDLLLSPLTRIIL